MQRQHLLLLFAVPLGLLSACPPPKASCKQTGCAVGSVCNQASGQCELVGQGGGGGGSGGGGGGGQSTGGGGGGGGGGMGNDAGRDSGVDAGVDAGADAGTDAGLVDPFDDGGVFVPGDICSNAIPVTFDAGPTALLSVNLAAAQHQYEAVCNSVFGMDTDGGDPPPTRDLLFTLTLPAPKKLVVTAFDTGDSGVGQDAVLALITSPCVQFAQLACIDMADLPEVLTVDYLPAGTYTLLLENSGNGLSDQSYEVLFELFDPAPPPPNDRCSGAQQLLFDGGVASARGTTTGAFNDTAGSSLSCSRNSGVHPDVFYQVTLTQTQDVRVGISRMASSRFLPVAALTNQCGPQSRANQRGCARGFGSDFTARSVPAGTYYIVVDGDGPWTGDFGIDVTLLPPTATPPNDTCATPTVLVPNMSQVADVTLANADYQPSCAPGSSGGDVVYQFTTTMPQRATVTATGMAVDGGSIPDGVISIRAAPCDLDTNEVVCADNFGISPEVALVRDLPAGTYYVVVAAYSPVAKFGVQLTLEPVLMPPTNDSCTMPDVVTFTAGMATRRVDLGLAVPDLTPDLCAMTADGADVVYEVTIPAMQTLTVVATPGDPRLDIVLFANSPICAGINEHCVDTTISGIPETLMVPNTTAAPKTVYVVAKASELRAPGELNITFALN